jgi:hypothetical protein
VQTLNLENLERWKNGGKIKAAYFEEEITGTTEERRQDQSCLF